MATLHRHHTDGTPNPDVSTEPAPIVTVTGALARSLAVLRLGFGLTFLWAFFDKLLALGFSTGRDPVTDNVDRFGDAARIHGGSQSERKRRRMIALAGPPLVRRRHRELTAGGHRVPRVDGQVDEHLIERAPAHCHVGRRGFERI